MSRRWISIAGVIFFLAAVSCVGFVFFYNRIQRSQAVPSDTSKSLINKPLPHAQLVDVYGSKVDEQVLRSGRVVLVFVTTDCDACGAEAKFLQTLLGRRKDVAFYGLVPFGSHPDSPDTAKKMFPFRIFYDEDNSFVHTMGLNRVPVKVFLEDGIIKKGWIGAALTDKAKQSFVEWLDGLP
jgi:peroxiredoxin